MNVGVPARRQGKMKMVGQPGAQHANLAGAGDVKQVGLETRENLFDEGNVAQKGGVEAEILFEGEREKSAGQLEGPDVAVLGESLGAITGANAEKRQVATPGKCLEVAASVGHAIDFVKRVGKVGDARR
jgi:hypothetical protein